VVLYVLFFVCDKVIKHFEGSIPESDQRGKKCDQFSVGEESAFYPFYLSHFLQFGIGSEYFFNGTVYYLSSVLV